MVTFLGLITSFALSSTVTTNEPVTSLPAASVTTAVPVAVTGYTPASMHVADASTPVTVYVFPSRPCTVNDVAINPLTLFSVPSYITVSELGTSLITYFSSPVRFITVSCPFTVLMI